MSYTYWMPPCPKPPKLKKRKRKIISPRQQAIRELDSLVAKIVHLRDQNICVLCGSTFKPEAGHIFVRGRMRVRFDLANVHIQCSSCNLRHRFDQAPYFSWYIDKYGLSAFKELYHLAEDEPYFKWLLPELKQMIVDYTNIYKELVGKSLDTTNNNKTETLKWVVVPKTLNR